MIFHTSHTTMYLLSAKSVLFPTSMIMTSLPLSVLTSSIHFEVCWNELRSVNKQQQYKITVQINHVYQKIKTVGILAIVKSVHKQVLLLIKKRRASCVK